MYVKFTYLSHVTENLNIDYHIERLVRKALKICETRKKAAIALGIHERTLYLYIKRFKIS